MIVHICKSVYHKGQDFTRKQSELGIAYPVAYMAEFSYNRF